MKMTTGIILGVLVLITFLGLFAFKGKVQEKEKVSQSERVQKTKIANNPYHGLRTQAINTTLDQLQLKLDLDKDVYGIIMDWNMGNAIVTVISFQTGDASVYMSTGQAFIGGYAHETIIKAAKQFVNAGEEFFPKAIKTEKTAPTNEKKVNFYLLTKSGRYYIEDDFSKIKNNTSDLVGLFEAANQVITEYRLMTEKK
jgi:hypothetical protein